MPSELHFNGKKRNFRVFFCINFCILCFLGTWTLLKKTAISFYNQCNELGIILLNKIAKVINLPENYFSDKFDLPMALLRCNFYPERPTFSADKDYGIAPHTDYGCLTLLFTEGEPGLEIKTLSGKWK